MKIFSAWRKKKSSFFLVYRAAIWFGKKDFGNSLDFLNEAISLNPNWVWVYRFRALVRERLGQDKQAMEDYNSALSIHPKDSQSLVGLGHFLGRQRNYQAAMAALSQAIQLSPKLSSAYLERGCIWNCLGETERAIEDLNKAVSLGLRNDQLHYERGNCYGKLGRINDALADINEAIRINPHHADALVQCGLIWLEKGDLEQALENVNLGISKKPFWLAESYYGRANVRLARNEIDLAMEDYSLAIELKPNCSDYYLTYAWVLIKKGDNNSAISYIQKAHDIVKNKYSANPSESSTDHPELQRVMDALNWASEIKKNEP